jgi:hypothetical protein
MAALTDVALVEMMADEMVSTRAVSRVDVRAEQLVVS